MARGDMAVESMRARMALAEAAGFLAGAAGQMAPDQQRAAMEIYGRAAEVLGWRASKAEPEDQVEAGADG